MNVSAWAIRRPLPALMIFFVLCVAGLWGFHQLPIAALADEFYGSHLRQAHGLIDARDPEDADLLALALMTRLPV
jgi:hypothetical protein